MNLRFAGCVRVSLLAVAILVARAVLAQEPPRRSSPPLSSPATDELAPPALPPMATPSPRPDGRLAVHLKDGSRVVGKLAGIDKLKLKTSFGEIAVPYDSILGLRITEPGSSSGGPPAGTTVLFRNGDQLTAEPPVITFKLETAWGEAAIAAKHVESLVMTADRMTWLWDGRWRLVNEPPPGRGPSATPHYYPTPHVGPYAVPPDAYPTPPTVPAPYGPPPLGPGTPVAPSYSIPSTLPAPLR